MRRTQISVVMVIGALLLAASTSVAFAQMGEPGPTNKDEAMTLSMTTVSTPDGASSPAVSNRFDFLGQVSRIGQSAWEYQRFLPAEGSLPVYSFAQFYVRRWL